MTIDAVTDFIHANRDRYVRELTEYLAIPSISALPDHAADVARCAEWTAAELKRIGLEHVRVIGTPGNPVVCGDWLHAEGAPTILFYGHYDVQPVDPLDEWESPPVRGHDSARARSTRAARPTTRGRSSCTARRSRPVSAEQPDACRSIVKAAHRGRGGGGQHPSRPLPPGASRRGWPPDVIVISDTPMFDRDVPSICYGLRGLVLLLRSTCGARATDLHSGSFGGAVANPAFVLAQMLAQMKDRSGRVQDSRSSTMTCGLSRTTRSGPSSRSCRSTSAATAPIWAPRSCSARPGSPPWSGSGAGRRSRSTACSRASPATAPRR